MHIDAQIIPGGVIVVSWLLLSAALALAVWRAPWSALLREPRRMHLVAGGAVALRVLWSLNIRSVEGLVLHLLGLTTFTLVVGWCLSLLAASAALAALTLILGLEPAGYAVAWLLSVFLPASVSWWLARLLYRPRLRNPFVYILGAGFAGGALVVLVDALVAFSLLAVAGQDRWLAGALDVWPLLFLVMFSEGFINGMSIAALAIFYPDWVKTFDDRFYLDGG